MRKSSALKRDLSGRKLSTVPHPAEGSTPEFDRGRLVRELLSLGNPKINSELAQQIGEEVEAELKRRSVPQITPELISELVQFKLEELGLLEIRRRGKPPAPAAQPAASPAPAKPAPEDEPTVSLYPEGVDLAAKVALTQLPTLEKMLRPEARAHALPLPPKASLKISAQSSARLQAAHGLSEAQLQTRLEALFDQIAGEAAAAEPPSPSATAPELLAVEFFNCMANQEFYPAAAPLMAFLEVSVSQRAEDAPEILLAWDAAKFAAGDLLETARGHWRAGRSVRFSFAAADDLEPAVFAVFLRGLERSLMSLPEDLPFPPAVGLSMRADHPRAAEFAELALSGAYYPQFQFQWILSGGAEALEDSALEKVLKVTWKKSEPSLVFLDEADGASCISRPGISEAGRPGGPPALSQGRGLSLGSLNLSIVGSGGDVDWTKLRRMTRTALRFLDNLRAHTTPAAETKPSRLGLGVMGFAELLLKLGIPYDSEDAVVLADKIFRFLQEEAGRTAQALEEQRRSALVSPSGALQIAARPPSPLSLRAEPALAELAEVTPALEPLAAVVTEGRVLPLLQQIAQRRKVWSEGVAQEIMQKGSVREAEGATRPLRRLCAIRAELDERWPLRVLGAAQPHCPEEESFEFRLNECGDLAELRARVAEYLGYGLRRFRLAKNPDLPEAEPQVESDIASQSDPIPELESPLDAEQNLEPLAAEAAAASLALTLEELAEDLSAVAASDSAEAEETTVVQEEIPVPYPALQPRERPEVLRATTRLIQTGCGPLHVSFARDAQGPYEVRASLGHSGSCAHAQTEVISRLLSLCLSTGIDQRLVYEQLRGVRCPQGAIDHGDEIVSCADGIARVFERELGFSRTTEQGGSAAAHPAHEEEEEITAVTSLQDLH
ncbi:MAG: hypothetical protein U1F66_09900 [bacterium]